MKTKREKLLEIALLKEKVERLTGKKVILREDEKLNSVFKPLRIKERLEPKRKELVDKGIIVVDESTKVLTFKGYMEYKKYFILYTFYKNYIVDVNGSVNLHGKNLSSIDIQFNNVRGFFDCNNNKLTSLHNCPKIASGGFYCNNNKLTSLEGCPKTIGRDFSCSDNKLTSLKHCPKIVSGSFYCVSNKLTSLEGCPKTVGGDFWCRNNSKQFTKEEVLKVCDVKDKIYV